MASKIDVHENARFERGWFAFSMVMMAVMTVAVVTALTGILGSGPLAKGETRFPGDTVLARYERITRVQTPTQIDFDLDLSRGRSPPVAVMHLDNTFFATRDIKDILPRPDASRVDPDGISYLFALSPQRHGLVSFRFTPLTAGDTSATVSVNGDTAAVHQFVLP